MKKDKEKEHRKLYSYNTPLQDESVGLLAGQSSNMLVISIPVL